MSDRECEEFEDVFPLRDDSRFGEWTSRVETLSSSAVLIREAAADGPDGRRMKDVQLVTERLPILEVKDNVPKIAERLVLLAEIDGVHVGFCVSSPGLQDSDPLFIQEIGVVPDAQGRGIGMALLCTAAEREPRRDIALATEDDNDEAQALNKKFAKFIGANIQRATLKLIGIATLVSHKVRTIALGSSNVRRTNRKMVGTPTYKEWRIACP